MIELAIQVFEISVQVIFPAPRTFMKDRVDSDAQWLTDNASGFAIPPDQVRLRQSDVLFGYDLNVQLFGGNGNGTLAPYRYLMPVSAKPKTRKRKRQFPA